MMEWQQVFVLTTFLVFSTKSPGLICVKINVITVIIGENVVNGYYATAPVFDIAFYEMRKKYPLVFENVTNYLFYKSNASSCEESDYLMHETAIEIYSYVTVNPGYSVIFSPGCTLEIGTLGDFARELNMPLIASTALPATMLTEKQRYPTVISFDPAGESSLSLATMAFFRYFGYKGRLSVLCDHLEDFPSLAVFCTAECRRLQSLLVPNKQQFHLNATFSWFNSNWSQRIDNHTDYDLILTVAKNHSKIIVMITRENVVRDLMVAAQRLNMTDGEFVFLYLQQNQVPGSAELTWRTNGSNDQIAFDSFSRLIVIRYRDINWERLAVFADTVKYQSENVYGQVYSDVDRKNAFSVSTYESVVAWAELMNETLRNTHTTSIDGLNFTRSFVNRTFRMEHDDVTIQSDGIRAADIFVLKMNIFTGDFESAWQFSFAMNRLTNVTDFADEWDGTNGSLSDIFFNAEHRDTDSAAAKLNKPAEVVAGVLCALFLPVIFATLYRFRKRFNCAVDDSTWWRLEPNRMKSISPADAHAKNLTFGIAITKYDEETVWIQSSRLDINMDSIMHNKITRKTLAEIRAVHHDNIGKLYGIAIHEGRMDLLWQFGRGSLRSLLDDETFDLDIGLKMSLVFEILSGLQYIHTSALRFHGSLSSLNTMMDSRYSIKICAAGSSRIFSALTGDRSALTEVSMELWLAPEMLSSSIHAGSKEADVYAVAVVVCEILTSNLSLKLDLKNSNSIIRTLSTLTSSVSGSGTMNKDVPTEVRRLISDCFGFDPRERPKLTAVIAELGKWFPKISVIDRMLQRFQKYSEDLELMVKARTDELRVEGAKVNALLEEIMPPTLISKLRNKEVISAEGYESVTIFFSSLIDFGEFCSNSTPLKIVILLNKLYSVFDTILLEHDVYKVETIKDGYMVASGVPIRNGNGHAVEVATMATEFLRISLAGTLLAVQPHRLQIRIGIHTGSVAAGVVGQLMPRYCLFGDTVNTASRMESHGQASKIHVSPSTENLLRSNESFVIESRGLVPIKGKGMIETFWLSKN